MSKNKSEYKEDEFLIKSIKKQQENWIKKKKEEHKLDYTKGLSEDDGELLEE